VGGGGNERLVFGQREKLANWIIQRLENLSDQDIRAVAKRVIELRRGHPGRAKKWGGTDGLAMLTEIDALKPYSNFKVEAAIAKLQELQPARYGRYSRDTLLVRYREVKRPFDSKRRK